VLTELFDWRAIFFVQAPIVAGALVVALDPRARGLRREQEAAGHSGISRRDLVLANVGFALVFAALVGALFLGVLLAVEVWRYSPLQSAVLVSALPLGMVVGRACRAAASLELVVGGAVLLAAGLVGLAMVPGARPVMAAVAFAACGAGFDLLHEVLDGVAVPADGPAIRASSVSVGARHAGLVLGLVLIAPVLSSSIEVGIERATLSATRTMLVSDLDLRDKLPVTWQLRSAIEEAPRGQVPDLGAVFDEAGAEGDNALARTRDDLFDTVTDAITRAFRPAFAIAAGLAALAAVPTLFVVRSSPHRADARSGQRRASVLGIGALAVVAVGLLAMESRAGAWSVGEFEEEDPCATGPDPFPGDGLDAAVQRIALSALDGAACELGTSRERLVLSLDEGSGFDDVEWDDATLEQALRDGTRRAIDDAEERGTLPGWAAAAMGFLVDRAPIDWLVEGIPLG
jgi:hypothetical protein